MKIINFTIGKIIDRLIEEYCVAVKKEEIKKPYANALYNTWKWVDEWENYGEGE